mmetsp:Transcript_3405/g.6744  ORF Transcript_3405/g.6744 Transcript_3405/m.6744 type:complete len:91 (+) Transcript_3405:1577-1849(+)
MQGAISPRVEERAHFGKKSANPNAGAIVGADVHSSHISSEISQLEMQVPLQVKSQSIDEHSATKKSSWHAMETGLSPKPDVQTEHVQFLG